MRRLEASVEDSGEHGNGERPASAGLIADHRESQLNLLLGLPRSRRLLAAVAKIRVHRHSRCSVRPASGSNLTFKSGARRGGDDFVGIGDPLEGLGLGVVVFEEPIDRRLEIDDGSEDSALETPLR